MPLPNWDEVRRSLASAIAAALPLQIRKAGKGPVAGVGLHVDAFYGSAGLYLLPEADAGKLSARELDNIGDWPISTDWVPSEDHSQAFAAQWGVWDKWFSGHLDELSTTEADQKFRQLLQVACEAMREVELDGLLDTFPQNGDIQDHHCRARRTQRTLCGAVSVVRKNGNHPCTW
jgi:hypothetical protein